MINIVEVIINGRKRQYDNVSHYRTKENAEEAARHMRRFGDTTFIHFTPGHPRPYHVYNRVLAKYGGMKRSR